MNRAEIAGVVFMLVLVGLVIWAAIEDGKKFDAYKQANHCREAGYIEGHLSTGTAIGANGQVVMVTTSTPRKTRWLCDNEVEIIR